MSSTSSNVRMRWCATVLFDGQDGWLLLLVVCKSAVIRILFLVSNKTVMRYTKKTVTTVEKITSG